MDIETIIGNYAFPIVMCLWFMFRTEKVIQANTEITRDLRNIILAYVEKYPNYSLKAS